MRDTFYCTHVTTGNLLNTVTIFWALCDVREGRVVFGAKTKAGTDKKKQHLFFGGGGGKTLNPKLLMVCRSEPCME